jgi:hypothetical protein
MNRVLDNAAEINGADKNEIGMVVHEYPGLDFPYKYLERGVLNVMSWIDVCVVMIEAQEAFDKEHLAWQGIMCALPQCQFFVDKPPGMPFISYLFGV